MTETTPAPQGAGFFPFRDEAASDWKVINGLNLRVNGFLTRFANQIAFSTATYVSPSPGRLPAAPSHAANAGVNATAGDASASLSGR